VAAPGVVSLDEARRLALAALPPAAPSPEWVPLEVALGRVLAEDACAPTDLPPCARSLVDGWAVRSGTGPRLTVVGEVRMGADAPPLPPGAALAIPTGGMVPVGADAVVMQEDAHLLPGGVVELLRAPRPGDHIVARGADARALEVVVPAGRRLRPPEVAMLAAAGIERVRVRRRPRVAVLSTGDELLPLPAVPAGGRVPDANGPALVAALRRDGCTPEFLGVVPDEPDALRRAVDRGLGGDGLICSGGSSVGGRDFVPSVLAQALGRDPLFSGIALRPGRPTAAFAAAGRWALALPGHTVSALVVYELVFRDAIRRVGGEDRPPPRGWVEAVLTADVRAPADRELAVRVRLEVADDGLRAVPLTGSSAVVGTLARADGIVRCAAGSSQTAGALVRVLLLD
jgi:molybdopterin molybdotransferase